MRTKANLKDLVQHGFHYVLAEKNSTKIAQEALTLAQKVKAIPVSEKNTAREVVTSEGVRHVVLLNAERRQEELEILALRQEEGKAILAKWRKHAGKVHHHEILKGAQAELRKAGLQDLFDLGFDEDSFQGLTSEWKEKVHRTQEWAGWWVLATDTDLSVEEVARLYQGLSVIERGWREIKSVLKVRPLHHNLPRRIEAHLMICELAYLVEKMLELRVRKAGLKGTDGTPLTGAGAIERFLPVTVDEVGAKGSARTRLVVTQLQPAQREVLEAAGIPLEAYSRGWGRLD